MVGRSFPVSLAELEPWRVGNRTTSDEARKRLAQYLILEAIATAPAMNKLLTFKGGNALRFVYGNRRTTLDLDFTALTTFPDDPTAIRGMLDEALAIVSSKSSVKLRCQAVKRNPKSPAATHPTYSIKIGYQFPGDSQYGDFLASGKMVSTVVEVEISLNDIVCEITQNEYAHPFSGEIRVQVCALEDIIAEKLRALLQQPIRNRNRKQDVYDIAQMLRKNGANLSRHKIADYFVRKAGARGINVRKSAFDEDVRRRAQFEYETLFSVIDPDFIPFEDAWRRVTDLVNELDIPQ